MPAQHTPHLDAARAVTEQDADGLQRRHAVVLHADIVNYSRLMADDEQATVATVRHYQGLVADAVAEADGTLVNFVGDSFLAVFDDAYAAMRAAVAISSAVGEYNRTLPRTRRTWFRVGLDAGQIVVAGDGRYFGDPLNIAARIQALADVGGINVTEAVYTALDEPALRLISLGSRRLRNIPGTVRVYRLAGMREDGGGHTRSGALSPSIALMPTRISGTEADRTIAEALHLDLVKSLGDIPGLTVIDDDGSGPGRTGAVDARYYLETGVVASRGRLRVYCMLGEFDTVNRVWAGRWEGTTDDLFTLQDIVSAGTRRAMEIELVIGEPARLYHEELDAEARDAVYHGWHNLTLGTREGWRIARQRFTDVVRTHPDAVTAHALAAFASWMGAVEGFSSAPAQDLEDAARHAARGIELNDPTGLSYLVVAALRLYAGEDLDAALDAAEESLARRPTCDISFGVLGSVRRYLGEWHAAVQACERAVELGGLGHPWFLTVEASAYYVGERYHEAAEVAERVAEHDPSAREALLVLAASQQALGLSRRARATVATLLDRFPDSRREGLARRHPFRDPAILERWDRHLSAAGVP
ncbi:MAG TPA: adenylate/guanylate cyclase domain-containing protein [Euzebyales bacterium]